MRRYNKTLAMLVAMATVLTGLPAPVMAAEAEGQGEVQIYDGPVHTEDAGEYELKWADEFEEALDDADWNVELHEPGWVNKELQKYVDSEDNIQVSDGALHLIPVRTEVEVEVNEVEGNILKNANFMEDDGDDKKNFKNWTETIANWGGDTGFSEATRVAEPGRVTYSIDEVGADDWCVQLCQTGIELVSGKKYTATLKINSTIERTVKIGVMPTDNSGWYGGTDAKLNAGNNDISFDFTMEQDESDAKFYVSMGKIAGEDSSAYGSHVITISGMSLVEEKAPFELSNADFANGLEGWETSEYWGTGSVFSSSTGDGAIVFDIEDSGSQNWHTQLKHNVGLEAGRKYTVSFDAESSIDRSIETSVMGKFDGSDKWCGGVTQALSANDPKTISFEFTMPENVTETAFSISMGLFGADNKTEYEPHTIKISNVSFTEEEVEDTGSAGGTDTATVYEYTSGRINTQDKHTFTYGRFEARAKVPVGQGYLPAFWLMANDEGLYGQWPRCGEIDCMEVMGQNTKKVYGTIHYGYSIDEQEESQGTYTADEYDADFDASEYHIYTCDWEPGKITWYVDGNKYHEESRWYSGNSGVGTYTYPAPFDQPFYIILNLAVGGGWVGNPDETTEFEGKDYAIDYVRVYQKNSYNEDVEKPADAPFVPREPDANGNYINNGDFAVDEDLDDDTGWKFLEALGGEATATIADNAIKIETANAGTADYSVQLVQANVPLENGAYYELSFDAVAGEERSMNVDIKAPDHGYSKYMTTQQPALTTEKQTFTYGFEMTNASDANARLEFNMGAAASTADIIISNVSIKKVAEPSDDDVEEQKGLLANGNYIYNGSFQEGSKYVGYWTIDKGAASVVGVTKLEDGRRLKVVMGEDNPPFVLTQEELGFKPGDPYCVSLEAQTDTDVDIDVIVGGISKRISLVAATEENAINKIEFTLPANARYTNKDFKIVVSSACTIYLDNISMTNDALIKNGSFDADKTGFEVFKNSDAKVSYVVDSISEDNALDFTIDDTGANDWSIQLMQYVKLVQGKKYILKFDAKSSMERDIKVKIQQDPDRYKGEGVPHDYYDYLGASDVSLTTEYQTFTNTFTMDQPTDENAKFNICLGNPKLLADNETPDPEGRITNQHRVVIDNIVLEEVVEDIPGEDSGDDEAGVNDISIVEVADYMYTGAAIKPAVTVYDGDKILKEGTDYTVTFANNINVNSLRKKNAGMGDDFNEELPYVKVIGKGNYTGEACANFNISHVTIANNNGTEKAGVVLTYNDQIQKDATKDQDVFKSLTVNKKSLKVGEDIELTLKDETGIATAGAKVPKSESGKYTLEVKGIGNYTGTIVKTIYVADKVKLIKNATITLGKNLKSVKFTGNKITLTPAWYDAGIKKYYKVEGGVAVTDSQELSKAEIDNVYVVKNGSDYLIEGTDYEVTYSNNRSVGTATMTITGIGEYSGSKSVTFKITGIPFADKAVIVNGLEAQTYTGKAIELDGLELYYKGSTSNKRLLEGPHYTVSYKNNVNTGKATVTFTGKASSGYTGSFSKTFSINAANIASMANNTAADITVPFSKAGAGINNQIKLTTADGSVLKPGTDYKVSYKNNNAISAKDAEKAPTAVITGIKNYTGTIEIPFNIEKAAVSDLDITVSRVAYKPNANSTTVYKPAVTVKDGGKKLSVNKDYVVIYNNYEQSDVSEFFEGNEEKKPSLVIKAADGSCYTGETEAIDGYVYKSTMSASNTKVIVLTDNVTYTGSQLKPGVKVYDFSKLNAKDQDEKAIIAKIKAAKNDAEGAAYMEELAETNDKVELISSANYVKSYGTNVKYGKNAGSVKITGVGSLYNGSIAVKFDILPKKLTR